MAAATRQPVDLRSLGPGRETSAISTLSRRDFLKICGATAALLGIGEGAISRIAEALEKAVSGVRQLSGLILPPTRGVRRLSSKPTIPTRRS